MKLSWLLIVLLLLPSVNASLIVFYEGNTTSVNSTHAIDQSGNSNHGALTGTMYDSTNQYWNFTSGTQRINLTTSSSINNINTTKNFTMMFWVKMNSSAPNQYDGFPVVFSKVTSVDELRIYYNNGTKRFALKSYFSNGTLFVDTAVTSTTAVSSASYDWHLVAVHFFGCPVINSSIERGYWDTVAAEVDSSPQCLVPFFKSGNITLFANWNVPVRRIRIYDSIVTREEIGAEYAAGPYGNATPSITSASVTFGSPVGIINETNYGAVGRRWGASVAVDKNADGTAESTSNSSFHMVVMNETGILGFNREDIGMDGLIQVLPNPGAEAWNYNGASYTTAAHFGCGTQLSSNVPYAWSGETTASCINGSISRTTDSHSGSYAVNITRNDTTDIGSLVSHWEKSPYLNLTAGNQYNFSIWVKAVSGTVLVQIQDRNTYTTCASASTTSTSWTLLSMNCSPSVNRSNGYRINIELAGTPSQGLWDDGYLQQWNGTDWDLFINTQFLASSQLRNKTKIVVDNGGVQVLIGTYMIPDIANISKDCYDSVNGWARCAPLNGTLWGYYLAAVYSNLTFHNATIQQRVWLEHWNEPDLGFWLPGITRPNSTRDNNYFVFYDETQAAFKQKLPLVKFGCCGFAQSLTNTGRNMSDMLFDNHTFDFWSTHNYDPAMTLSEDNGVHLDDGIARCVAFGADNCTKVLLDEFNNNKQYVQWYEPTYYQATVSDALLSFIFNYSTNGSFAMYQYSETKPMNGSIKPSEYPSWWVMVEEPGMTCGASACYRPPYYAYKENFAIHKPGFSVAQRSINYSRINVLGSNNSQNYTVTVQSRVAYDQTVNLTVDGSFNSFTDVETLRVYPYSSGMLINVSGYDAVHLAGNTECGASSSPLYCNTGGCYYSGTTCYLIPDFSTWQKCTTSGCS